MGPETRVELVGHPAGRDAYIAVDDATVCVTLAMEHTSTGCSEVLTPSTTHSYAADWTVGAGTVLMNAVPDGYSTMTMGVLSCPVTNNAVIVVDPDLSLDQILTGDGLPALINEGIASSDPPEGEPTCFPLRS